MSPNPVRRYLERLKAKWKITSNLQLFVVCVVFAVTGSLAVTVAKPILHALGISSQVMSPWLYYPLRILIIFPCYQVMLLIVGTLLGQFRFFWNFEKKMFGRLTGRRP